MTVRVEMNGLRGQGRDVEVVKVTRRLGTVLVRGAGPKRYRLADGLSCDGMGRPTAWQFWWIPPDERARILATLPQP